MSSSFHISAFTSNFSVVREGQHGRLRCCDRFKPRHTVATRCSVGGSSISVRDDVISSRMLDLDEVRANPKLSATLIKLPPNSPVKRKRRSNALPDLYQYLDGRVYLPPEEVSACLKLLDMEVEDFLRALLQPASHMARPPISSFYVGAAGLGASGAVYIGANLEFSGFPLNSSLHGEQFLVVNAFLHGEASLKMLAVNAAPCGHCRQFMCELADVDNLQLVFGAYKTPKTLSKLLPGRFGPADLLPGNTSRLLGQQPWAPLSLVSKSRSLLRRRGEKNPGIVETANLALSFAEKSYAPYTSCPAGIALRMADGSLHGGSYMESAAYNPSIGPFQAAIVQAVINGVSCYSQIQEAVLVEVEGGHVQHSKIVELMVSHIAPSARVTTLHIPSPTKMKK